MSIIQVARLTRSSMLKDTFHQLEKSDLLVLNMELEMSNGTSVDVQWNNSIEGISKHVEHF